jgi:hypothetical protein
MPDALSQVLNITRQPWDFTAGGLVILLEKVIQPANAAYVLCSHCSCISLRESAIGVVSHSNFAGRRPTN